MINNSLAAFKNFLGLITDFSVTPLCDWRTPLGTVHITRGQCLEAVCGTSLIGLSILTRNSTLATLGMTALTGRYLCNRIQARIMQHRISDVCAKSHQQADQRVVFLDSEDFFGNYNTYITVELLKQTSQNRYCMQHACVKSVEDVVKAVQSSDKKIALLVIQAHGDSNGIVLGEDKYLVTDRDSLWAVDQSKNSMQLCEDVLRTCQPYFHPHSVVVLRSCSTGNSMASIANKIAIAWKTRVVAPKEEIRGWDFVVHENSDTFDAFFNTTHGDITAHFDGRAGD